MGEQFVRVDPHAIQPESIRRAAECLRGGGLVAFPTETVYGIGVRADDDAAVERLFALKGRDRGKPIAYHIGDLSQLEALVDEIPPVARRLADRYWPGPMTLVLPGRAGEKVGVRFPANPIARSLLRETRALVVATSANRSGEPECVTGEQVHEAFGDTVDVILDGGSSELREASTVVEVGPGGWKLLREGIIDERAVRETASFRVLFVCSGNTCRSPMAGALFRQLLAERLGVPAERLDHAGVVVESAGTMAFYGGGASPGARQAMRQLGLSLEGHETRPITPALLEGADLVIAMTEEQARAIRSLAAGDDRVFLLDPAGANTLDPFGGSDELYRKTAEQIREKLAHWLPRVVERTFEGRR